MINNLATRPSIASGACPVGHRAKGWSADRRARAGARIRQFEPWRSSTGPQTGAGKTRSAANALKHGHRSQAYIQERRLLRQKMRLARHILRVSTCNLAICRAWLRARAAGAAPDAVVGLQDVMPFFQLILKALPPPGQTPVLRSPTACRAPLPGVPRATIREKPGHRFGIGRGTPALVPSASQIPGESRSRQKPPPADNAAP
jgi:hypothetical protein